MVTLNIILALVLIAMSYKFYSYKRRTNELLNKVIWTVEAVDYSIKEESDGTYALYYEKELVEGDLTLVAAHNLKDMYRGGNLLCLFDIYKDITKNTKRELWNGEQYEI